MAEHQSTRSEAIEPSIDQELKAVRYGRKQRLFIEADVRACIADAERLLKQLAPKWEGEHIMFIGIRWHPGRQVAENTAFQHNVGVALGVRQFDHIVNGSGYAYRALESVGGRLAEGRLPRWKEAHKSDARIKFAVVSACLVIFESQMLREAEKDGGALVDWWEAVYWIRRFYGNMLRVRDDAMSRRRAGRKGADARSSASKDLAGKVCELWRKLKTPELNRSSAIALRLSVSLETVHKHLEAAGLRQRKRKNPQGNLLS